MDSVFVDVCVSRRERDRQPLDDTHSIHGWMCSIFAMGDVSTHQSPQHSANRGAYQEARVSRCLNGSHKELQRFPKQCCLFNFCFLNLNILENGKHLLV